MLFILRLWMPQWKRQKEKEKDTWLQKELSNRTRRSGKLITKEPGADCIFHSLKMHWSCDLL